MSGIPSNKNDTSPRAIVFPHGRTAVAIIEPENLSGAEILAALKPPACSLTILLSGGADNIQTALLPQIGEFFQRVVSVAAIDCQALFIDGGTQSGVMKFLGEAIAERGRKTTAIGVAPAGKVTYPGAPQAGGAALDPNHSHFVLAKAGEWGGEIDAIFALAEACAKSSPMIVLLVNGGTLSKREILRAIRLNWPVIVIEKSGGFADELAAAREAVQFNDAVTREIVSDGALRFFPVDGSLEEFESLLLNEQSPRPTLREAWQRFATYDLNANLLQKGFNGLQLSGLILGVSGVLLMVIQKQMELHAALAPGGAPILKSFAGSLRVPILIIPMLTALLLAVSHRFRLGTKWILLRGASEAIKREIYNFRMRAGRYSGGGLQPGAPEDALYQQLETISHRLMKSEVSQHALRPYQGSIPPRWDTAPMTQSPKATPARADDGYSFLTPDQYIELRIDDQLKFYSRRAVRFDRQSWRLISLILGVGSAGTLFAALGLELWIAVTTSLAAAIAAYLKYKQVDETLVKYNQAANDLANLKAWWARLSPAAQRKRANRTRLVDLGEQILEQETTGWSQRMMDALESLLREEQKKDAKETSAAPPEPADQSTDGKLKETL